MGRKRLKTCSLLSLLLPKGKWTKISFTLIFSPFLSFIQTQRNKNFAKNIKKFSFPIHFLFLLLSVSSSIHSRWSLNTSRNVQCLADESIVQYNKWCEFSPLFYFHHNSQVDVWNGNKINGSYGLHVEECFAGNFWSWMISYISLYLSNSNE